MWYYLVTGCFDWKIDAFQQIVVRVYYILNLILKKLKTKTAFKLCHIILKVVH